MNLFEYIKSQLPQMPNVQIMKDLGASDELIDYVKETPWNTNFAIAEVIEGSGGGDTGEVWFVGSEYDDYDGQRFFALSSVGDIDHKPELYRDAENYDIYLNNKKLPYLTASTEDCSWANTEDPSNATENVKITRFGHSPKDYEYSAVARYINASTAPTSVEVSVKAK